MKELLLLKTMPFALKKYFFYRKREFASKEAIEAYQFEKIRKLVNHSWDSIPFYRNYWSQFGFSPEMLKGMEDLERIPTIDKRAIRNSQELMLSQFARVKNLKLTTTGGTTGMPMSFYIDQNVSIPKEAAALYNLFRRFNYKPYAPNLILQGERLDESLIERGIYWRRNYLQNALVMSSFHLNDSTIQQYVTKIREFQPHYIFAYPSSSTILCRLMKKNGLSAFKSLKHVICSSENVYGWQRELIQEVLGVRVFSHYGHSEKCVIAGECEHSSNLHFSPYYGYAELINSQGKPCSKEGELGEIVVTGFDQKDFVFIRYRTGDLAEYTSKACECGRNHFNVKKIVGREQDFVVNRNGDLSPFTCSDEVFWEIPPKVNAYQYVQSVKGELELRIEVKEALNAQEYAAIYKCLGEIFVGFSVSIAEVAHIPRTKSGKFNYLVQKISL
ncbi:MAG: phenylacetate--CoA ligase family protein [Marinifilaceae bacterium]